MSFRKEPITKNCTVLDVMGNRIVIPDERKVATANEIDVSNWQPFQIHGGKVTPCDLTYDGISFYMPEISGVPIDDPAARLNGVGDVFLSVKFTLSTDGVFDIDSTETPTIGFINRGNAVLFGQDEVTGDKTIQQPWYSWKIGEISSTYESSMRYFSVENQLSQAEIDAGPIYKKEITDPGFPGEVFWGFSFVSVIPAIAYGLPLADPDPLVSVREFGSYQMFGSNISNPVSGSEIWAYGDYTFSGPTIFHAFSASTPV